MSESRRSSNGGSRRAAGVRRTPAGKSARSGSAKSGAAKSGAATSGSAKGSSRTARTAGGASAGSKGTSAAAKRPTSRTSVSARHAGAAPKGAAGSRGKNAAATNFLNYPRAGKENPWRWIPSLRLVVGAIALFVLAGLGFSVWLYNDTEVPEPSDFALAQTSRVYFADGETEMGQFSEVNRTELPADEVPDTVKEAVVASEDSSFYENRGVSPRGILRAAVNNLQGGARQGASTITMQYVERYYTGTETSYVGKAKEAIMALKIDQELSKDEILSRYLNTIYFGRGAYGVQEASQAYFDKDASELDEAEAALLVAVIPSPSTYDPANSPEQATQLWDRVITRQVAEGQLTPEEADALEFPETVEPTSENSLGGTNGYLLAQVRNELVSEGFTEDEINTGGFTIVSTIDPAIQENTVQAVENLPDDRPEANRVGTVTMDPDTGAIRGMYGGADYVTQAQNDATQSRMQAGSIFKTFTLIAALEDGYPLDSRWDGNSPKSFRGGWTVKNFNDIDYGRVTLEKATTSSINTAYAEANLEVGPARTRETAVSLGLPEKTPGLTDDAANVLGSAS
ncbi:MAG TPA: penicillin-binding protein, partial [Candidatus Brachybacterium intestinipullorum]|nr:penicillin-binding protein [Candidatus Brachybacterium intestinipullorum]